MYEAVFSIDGGVVQRTVLDDNGGLCRDVGDTSDGSAFLSPQPCQPAVSVDVPFDTAPVPNGAHRLVVSVIDPAGDSALCSTGDYDRQPAAGRGAQRAERLRAGTPGAGWLARWRWRADRRAVRTRALDRRAPHRTGRAPDRRRAHRLRHHARVSGRPREHGCLRAHGGRRALHARAARQRGLAHGHAGLQSPSRRRSARRHAYARSTVRAGVRLRVSPHTASVGRTIRFAGRLLGGSIPRGGKQIVLEARSPGGRCDRVRRPAHDRRGRFRDAYTFNFPGPSTTAFAAVSEADADYPYATEIRTPCVSTSR